MFEPFQPSLIIVSKAIEAPTNIRRGYEAPPGTNAVAYFCIASVLIKKRFITLPAAIPRTSTAAPARFATTTSTTRSTPARTTGCPL